MPGHDRDERDRAVGVLARRDLALPLAEVEQRRRALPGSRRSRRARRSRSARRAWPPSAASAGTVSSLRSAASCVEERLGARPPARRRPPACRRTAPRAACGGSALRISQPGSPLVRTTAPTLLLGQPHHVAVEADHVAAVVDDRHAVRRVDHQAHAVGRVLADRRPAASRRASSGVLRDVAACRPAARPRRAPSARTSSMSLTLLQRGARGAQRDDRVVELHHRARGLAVDVGRVRGRRGCPPSARA